MLSQIINKASSELYAIRMRYMKGLELVGRVILNGRPIIDIRNGGRISIGDRVTLNSSNIGYHLNMHSPVKIYADRRAARISIGDLTRIHGSCLHAYRSITIGKKCLIAANCQIIDANGHDLSFDDVDQRIHTTGDSREIVIEDCVWVCANSLILPGVRIGRGSVIAAGKRGDQGDPADGRRGREPGQGDQDPRPVTCGSSQNVYVNSNTLVLAGGA